MDDLVFLGLTDYLGEDVGRERGVGALFDSEAKVVISGPFDFRLVCRAADRAGRARNHVDVRTQVVFAAITDFEHIDGAVVGTRVRNLRDVIAGASNCARSRVPFGPILPVD